MVLRHETLREANGGRKGMEIQNVTIRHEDLNNLNAILSLLQELKKNLLELQNAIQKKDADNYN